MYCVRNLRDTRVKESDGPLMKMLVPTGFLGALLAQTDLTLLISEPFSSCQNVLMLLLFKVCVPKQGLMHFPTQIHRD